MLKKIIQLVIVLIPICLFGWLLWLDIAPFGILSESMLVDGFSPYIDHILPGDRVSAYTYDQNGEVFVSILDEPTYFSLHRPQTDFETVTVELLYKNKDQTIIEIGALMDIYSNSYDLRPIQSLIVEDVDWPVIDENNVMLLMRNNDYSSVDDFYENPPKRSEIAVLGTDFDLSYHEQDYYSTNRVQSFDVSLRGYHKYLTYIKDEDFYLKLEYMDMNRMVGVDDVTVRIWNDDGDLWYEHIQVEDGNTTNNQISSKGTILIEQSNWPEGVYSVELSGTSDIFWRELSTSQRYVTFVGQVYIGDVVGYLEESIETDFFTNAKNLTLETYHSDSTQRVQIGSAEIMIPKSHKKENVHLQDSGIVYGYTPQGDIKISGDGKFAFSKDSFFEPDIVTISAGTDIDALGINYILSGIDTPNHENDWLIAGTTFNCNEIFDENGNAKITISTPLLHQNQANVYIHEIRIKFQKKKMSFFEFVSALRNRLPFGI